MIENKKKIEEELRIKKEAYEAAKVVLNNKTKEITEMKKKEEEEINAQKNMQGNNMQGGNQSTCMPCQPMNGCAPCNNNGFNNNGCNNGGMNGGNICGANGGNGTPGNPNGNSGSCLPDNHPACRKPGTGPGPNPPTGPGIPPPKGPTTDPDPDPPLTPEEKEQCDQARKDIAVCRREKQEKKNEKAEEDQRKDEDRNQKLLKYNRDLDETRERELRK